MKKFLMLCLLVIGVCVTSGCTKVPAGYVGVKVYLLGSDKGVSNEVLNPGRYWIGYNQDLYLFPTFQQNYSWTQDTHESSNRDESFTMQTSEGQTIGCDVAITYHYEEDKISQLFQQFREGNSEIRDTQLRNYTRNAMNAAASKLLVNEIYGPKKIEFINAAEKEVRDKSAPYGIIIDQLSLIGAFRLPEALTTALNAKNEAVQKAQQVENEVMQSKAEAEKSVAISEGEAKSILIRAKAQAEANRLLSASLTKELIEKTKVDKWDGVYPVFVSGGASQGIMIDASKLIDAKHSNKAAVSAPTSEDNAAETDDK